MELIGSDEELSEVVWRIPADVLKLLNDPVGYTGDAAQKSLAVAASARHLVV